MIHPKSVLLGAALLIGATAQAQELREFPLHVAGTSEAVELVLRPDPTAIAVLEDLRSVVLEGLVPADGRPIALELERIDLARLRMGIFVDGRARPELLDGLGLTLWRGRVAGETASEALLAFSLHGSHGWIERGSSRLHLIARPNARGDYAAGDTLLTDEAGLARQGVLPPLGCGTEELPGGPAAVVALPSAPQQQVSTGGLCSLKECKVAVESDYQLFQRFNDLSAMAAYVTALLGAVSDRYERQAETVLTFPYIGFYTDPDDPWQSQDNGGSTHDLYHEFRLAWLGNLPGGARLAHFLSGANMGLGGPAGLGGVGGLCSDSSNFAVSTSISGTSPFPVPPHPTNWDFFLVAHELGHNFGALHTHEYCPPLDECAIMPFFGPCQSQQVCGVVSTLMSYCSQCPGGFANIQNSFHPQIAVVMRDLAQACLPDFGGWIAAEAPDLVAAGVGAPLTAVVSTLPAGPVELHFRFDGGSWSSAPLTHLHGFTWEGSLPAVACGQALEWFVQYTDPDCGLISDPPDAPSSTYSPYVGAPVVVFTDDCELDRGWTAVNLGALSGDWERGVPVDDPSWIYDPATDADGSGQAWLTENALGPTGVRSGSVRLISPALDLSAGPGSLSYSYWLRLQHQNGTDHVRVEASDNGLAGPWVEVARHVWNGHVWRHHEIGTHELAAAGLLPSSDTRVRFTATEASPSTAMEAGLDAFSAAVLTCVEAPPLAYCEPSGANSISAQGARLAHVAGELGGDLTLLVERVPAAPGLLFHGTQGIDAPFGCGRRCVGGSVVRAGAYLPSADSFQLQLDTAGLAGGPVHLQYGYRDPAWQPSCGASFNLSNALAY